jgi:uncharacterized protein (DUF488 family)
MNKAKPLDPQIIFTIGHSNHDLGKFPGLLKQNGIEVVVDIRSNPYSRFAPRFNKTDVYNTLHNNGIKYLFLGKEPAGLAIGRFITPKGMLCILVLLRPLHFLRVLRG